MVRLRARRTLPTLPAAALWAGPAVMAVLLTPLAAGGQELSPVERRIKEAVRRQAHEAVDFLERVVNINSGTLNAEGVQEVGGIFREELDRVGFETHWISMPDEVKRAGHLFAERRGNRGKRLLLIGHLDTVFEKDGPFQRWERRGEVASGPGVSDMKGGDVVLLYALKALHEVGALEGTTITVALTGDEEKPGRPLSLARGDLIEAAGRSDVALGFEGAVGINNATLARRGSSSWLLTVKGKSGHSSQIFKSDLGAGAIFETARILSTFYQEVRGEEYLSFNPGLILGGTEVDYDPEDARGQAFGKTNVVAQTVTVHGGLRFISEEQRERAREKMREIVSRSLPQTSAEITFSDDAYPAMSPTEGNRRLLELYDRVSQDLGHGPITPLDPGDRGAADISFVAPLIDSLAGLGPVGKGSHSVDDELDLTSLPVATERAAVMIYRLSSDHPD